jgi:hypothetical protein
MASTDLPAEIWVVIALIAAYSAAFKSVEFVDGPIGDTPGGAVNDERVKKAA